MQIVSGHYDARSPLMKLAYRCLHAFNSRRVECGGGFIQKQHLRRKNPGASQCQALLFAAG